MTKFNSDLQKILIISSFSMILAMIIVLSASIDRIKNIEKEIVSLKKSVQYQPKLPASEILKVGTVGEAKEASIGEGSDMSVQDVQIPSVVFNTTGTILEIQSNRLIVKGDGTNFADSVIRDLNAVFTSQTITFITENQGIVEYRGLEGLKYLKIGNNILIEGSENLRGKTEFKVKTINVI